MHRSDAGHDRVMAVAHLLHVSARFVARNPARVVVRSGDLAVQRQGRLERDQGSTGARVVEEGFIQALRRRGQFSRGFVDLDTVLPEQCEARAVHSRIAVPARGHDPRDASRQDRVHARRSPPVRRAGL